ncbi:VWA domain-containing protein [Methylocucumis oryzae]|uniref:von Willebrand factor A n=1 Tax=Methylocucumis oryzae TaxID=1632867 RepID=A0A0F3IGD6_9GAMM|nr:VWA domain-containing protein [Methylocucumis oryzae]KJV05816.1 von Willebrand factor A [Methylocucumis oryzae]
MTDFHFIRPLALLALLPALLLAYVLIKRKLSHSVWSSVCDAELLPFLLIDKAAKQNRINLGLGLLASVLAIIALAGPTWERIPVPVFRNTSALVIALSLSHSMDAQDIKPSRLTRARYKIADLLQQRKDGQTALLVYAGDAFTVTPLTDDTATIANQLEVLTTDLMPSPGRNARLAFTKAISLFKQAGLQKGQLVLITDGIDEAPNDLVALAEHENITVSVLGVGTSEGAPVALPGGGFLKDEHGAIVLPKLDEAKLSQLASLGHGIYRTLGADDNDIKALQALLATPLTADNKTDATDVKLDQWQDVGPWVLLLVLPLAALLFRKGLLIFALCVLLPQPNEAYAWSWQDLWQTQEQQAQKAFNGQNYAQAAKQFTRPDWKAAAKYKAGEGYSEQDYQDALKKLTTSDGFYNLGNALAGSGELEKAIDAYQRALKLNPENADAKYNKELVEKALEKQQQDKQKQQQDQQQQQQNQKQQQDQQQQSSEQQASENDAKPEQKPEHGGQQQDSQQQDQQRDQQKQAQQQQKQQESEQQQAAAQQEPAEPKKDDDKQDPVAGESSAKLNDKQQAINEQWLKRIPDDPGGLLRRKFQYQYGQRNAEQSDKPW